jgi:hypothetical protein
MSKHVVETSTCIFQSLPLYQVIVDNECQGQMDLVYPVTCILIKHENYCNSSLWWSALQYFQCLPKMYEVLMEY